MTLGPITRKLQKMVPKHRILTDEDECRLYDSDGLPMHRGVTPGVLLRAYEAEVVQSVGVLSAAGIPCVDSGAGTGMRAA